MPNKAPNNSSASIRWSLSEASVIYRSVFEWGRWSSSPLVQIGQRSFWVESHRQILTLVAVKLLVCSPRRAVWIYNQKPAFISVCWAQQFKTHTRNLRARSPSLLCGFAFKDPQGFFLPLFSFLSLWRRHKGGWVLSWLKVKRQWTEKPWLIKPMVRWGSIPSTFMTELPAFWYIWMASYQWFFSPFIDPIYLTISF